MSTTSSRVLLMGDPSHFRIKTGANPHTRGRWGFRKAVDSDLARRQWDAAVRTFRQYGVRVDVVPPHRDAPGLVFPANAGFLLEKSVPVPWSQKHFYLSNLLPGRSVEKEIYRKALTSLGMNVRELPEEFRFEGEADFFPAADGYVLTYGAIEKQRWVPAAGFPPYRRVYGFRTDVAILETLAALVPEKRIFPLELCREAYYHGDTVACAMGKKLEFLMLYPQGITPASLENLKKEFHGKLILLGKEDAEAYAANSYYLDANGEQFLFCPPVLSRELLQTLEELKIRPVPMDVSEFFTKGGGSVKCMLCDLGPPDQALAKQAK